MKAPGASTGHRRRLLLGALGVTFVGAVVATVVLMLLAVGHDHQQTAHQEAVASHLHQQRRAVEARGRVVTSELETTQRLVASLQGTLGRTNASVRAVADQLDTAQADSSANGVDIQNLNVCLAGVQEALNQASVGDDSGAVSSLSSVATSCSHAGPAS